MDDENLSFALVVSSIVGLLTGYFVDHWLGTSPWLTMIDLGVTAFILIFRSDK